MFPTLTKIARFILLSTLTGIASCNDSPPFDSSAFCAGGPCLKASLEEGTVGYRILLVGDAGALVDNESESSAQAPLLKTLEYFSGLMPDRTAIVFLGDNIYEAGLPDKTGPSSGVDKNCRSRACAEKRIDAQIDVLKRSGARGVFVPGNHDWDDAGREGWKRIINLGEYIADSRETKRINVDLIPKNGCPGPITAALSGKKMEVSLIALDTQWWLHAHRKPGKDDNPSHCKGATEAEVVESLEKQIKEEIAKKRHILLVGHHPLKSYGEHGAFYTMEDLVRPLHLLKQMFRGSVFGGRQELHNTIYKNMRVKIQGAIHNAHRNVKTPIIFAAGHDHSLQIINDREGVLHLVSGAGSGDRGTRVGQGEGTIFSHANRKSGGFIAVDYMQSGAIRLVVIEAPSDGEECESHGEKTCVVFSAWAKNSSNTIKIPRKVPAGS